VGGLVKSIALLLGLLVLGVAPGSASATELCSTPGFCTPYGIGTEVKMVEVTGTPAEFVTQQATTKCGEDVGEFTTTAAGALLEAELTVLSFSECLAGCSSATALNLPWETTINTSSLNNGIMTAEGLLQVKLNGCPGPTSCTLTAKKIEFVITGGNPALVTVKVAMAGTSPCNSSLWRSTFKVIKPTALYVL
jgi:hypothetical protein